MLRSLYLFALFVVIALGAVWLADNPGRVSVRWDAYAIETTMVVLLGAGLVLALIISVLILIYRWLRKSPDRLGGVFASRRRSKGLDAISHGMVAIASGNAVEARRAAIEAEKHLKGEPMTLLLAAQAAELNRDERATDIYYSKMAENPDTELLGLRGLINRAKRAGDTLKAKELAERANQVKPGTEWVVQDLLDLSIQLEDYEAAFQYLERNLRGKAAKDPQKLHLKAILMYERALQKIVQSDMPLAQTFLQQAHDLDPSFVPAVAKLISMSEAGRRQDKLIQSAWTVTPHPDVATAIKNLTPVESEGDWYVRAKKIFLSANPDHRESLLVLASAAMAAREWGDARKYLKALVETDPTAGVYRLLAELEEKANADAAASRNWIQKMATAKPDPEWHCRQCARVQRKWTSNCPSCASFDSFTWKSTDYDNEGTMLEAQVVKELLN